MVVGMTDILDREGTWTFAEFSAIPENRASKQTCLAGLLMQCWYNEAILALFDENMMLQCSLLAILIAREIQCST